MLKPADAIATKALVTIVFSLIIVPLVVYTTIHDAERADEHAFAR